MNLLCNCVIFSPQFAHNDNFHLIFTLYFLLIYPELDNAVEIATLEWHN